MNTGKSIIVLLALAMAWAAPAAPTVVKVIPPAGAKEDATELTVHNGATMTLQPDSEGYVSTTVDIPSPVYGTLYSNNARTQLWLVPAATIQTLDSLIK